MASEVNPPRHLLDVNVLVALVLPTHVHHERAHAWFAGSVAWASCAVTEGGLLRLISQPAVVGESASTARALDVLRALHLDPDHRWLADDASFVDSVIDLARLTSPRDVTDLHLVDLAARNGCVLATLDRGIPTLLGEADRHHVLVLPE